LVNELLAVDLIRPASAQAGNAPIGEMIPVTIAYAPPVLETFSDMQDLLLLDPIHEVDDAGWPMAPRQAQA